MAKKASKSEIINKFVSSHPDATWREAKATLARKGISAGYFASQRSKLKGGFATNGPIERKGRTTTSQQPASDRQVVDATGELKSAAEFVRAVGGLEAAYSLLATLRDVQV